MSDPALPSETSSNHGTTPNRLKTNRTFQDIAVIGGHLVKFWSQCMYGLYRTNLDRIIAKSIDDGDGKKSSEELEAAVRQIVSRVISSEKVAMTNLSS